MTQGSDNRKQKREAEKLLKNTGIHTFESITYVTGFLEGEFEDWPANIQDTIYAAMEKKAKEVELPLALVHAYCDKDLDNGKFFVRVILSEIVAYDTKGTKH